MTIIECRTQSELEAALKLKDVEIHLKGDKSFDVCGSSTVRAYGSSTVRASKYSAIHVLSKTCKAKGGVQIRPKRPKMAKEWCAHYGVDVVKGVAILFKGVNAEWKTSRNFEYKPGSTPKAPDWDGGKAECGGGLHFSPTPGHVLEFEPHAKHFIA
jgi:hypothetical protein